MGFAEVLHALRQNKLDFLLEPTTVFLSDFIVHVFLVPHYLSSPPDCFLFLNISTGDNLTLCSCMPCAARAFSKMLARHYCCETQLWEKTKAGSEPLSQFPLGSTICQSQFSARTVVSTARGDWVQERRCFMNIWQFGRMEVSGHSREWSAVLVTFLHQVCNLSHPRLVIKSWNLEFVSVYRKISCTPRRLALIWLSKLR